MTESVKINVGAGDKLGSDRGYVNIDLRKLPKTDLGATIVSLPFASNSADEIIASDVLEHVPRHHLLAALVEIQRVLKLGGVLKIKMPDLRALSEAYVAGRMDAHEFSRRIYGNQEGGDPANFHKAGLDPATLKLTLEALGFADVKVTSLDGADFGNMGARGVKYALSK